jgi:hypothetical protein
VVRLTGVNASAEPLDGGTLALYADDAAGTRRAAIALDHVRTVSAAPGAALTSARFQAPANAERFVAVYQGKLGDELPAPNADPAGSFPGAVIGKVLGGLRVEEVFATGGRWKVRTPRGVFLLPLMTGEFEQVQWGDAESLIVARTRFGTGQANRVVAYEIERQQDSAELVAASTPEGPALQLRQISAAVFPFGVPLGTRVNFSQSIAHRQELVRIERTITSVYDDAAGVYRVVDADFSTPTVETAVDTEVPFSRSFPIVLDLDHLFTVNPSPYGWELIDVAADRAGRLLGLVAVYLTDIGLEPVTFPLYFVNREGELHAVGETAVVPRYPTGISQIWALLDLTAGRVLASTADPVITISWRERSVLGPVSRPVVGLAVAMRRVEVRQGGPDPGVFDLGWRAQSFLGPNYPRDAITATLATAGGIQALTVAGELRPELRAAAAAAGFVDFTLTRTHVVSEHVYGCQTETPQPSGCLAIRIGGEGSDVTRAPAQLESALRSRPAPAGERLAFLATDYTAGEVALATLIAWDPATSQAHVRHRLPGLSLGDSHVLVAATGTAALVVSEMLDFLAADPFVTTSAVVALDGTAPPAIFTGEDLGASFTLLDPGYLYNVRDLRFYRARPPLQRTALPAPLAAVAAKPVGDYHLIRLP